MLGAPGWSRGEGANRNRGDAMDDGWYEDFVAGTVFRTPGKTLSEAEILEWAFAYDPQPFHMDRVAAERSVYGGLIASGW